ncbi:hypothetical protein BHE74_00003275 [Ensete ventricosum]|nr:hypothetical protein BHE74_00003275 [Ensete ventricosum]
MEIRPSWEEALTFPVEKRAGELEVDEEDIRNVELRLVAMVKAEEAFAALVRNPVGAKEKDDPTTLEEGVGATAWRGEGGFSGVSSEAGSREGLHQQEKKVTHHDGVACASGMDTYRQVPEMEGRL